MAGSNAKLPPVAEDWERALAIVAHPDDLEYGGASAIARWTSQGKSLAYLIATRGEAGIDSMSPEEAAPVREAEQRKSAAVVGVDTVEFLDHTDGVVEYGLPLRREFARAIRRHRPEVVITGNFHLQWPGGGFNMADHRSVGLAAMDASRDAGNRWIFPELLGEGMQPWNGVRMLLVPGSPDMTHAVDVTDSIDKGVASLEQHRAYIDNLGGSFDADTFLRMSASASGELAGCEYAVTFEVIKL